MGFDAVGGVLLTTQPGSHARPRSLHTRLTVALAPQDLRARIAQGLPGVVVHADDLWRSADALAADRSSDRVANRARLDAAAARALHDVETARSQREHLDASRQALLDGATWAIELHADLPSIHGAVEAAGAVLEARQAEQRAARQRLDRVLEQRAAAAAAIDEADRELGELVGVGMDETGLRRELEASGQAVRAAQAAHAATLDRIQALQVEQAELEARSVELSGAQAGSGTGLVDPSLVDRVRGWLTSWIDEAGALGLDPHAQALADAWTDLLADLADLSRDAAPRPSDAALTAAEARLAHATAALERLDAAAAAVDPAARAELDAAHEAVLAAEERSERRIGAASARRKLDAVRAAERALLDQHGFESYLHVLLSGGRAAVGGPERLAAERAILAASAARDALVAALQRSPELEYLSTERTRLQAHTVDLLGVDPGEHAVALLRAHPLVSRSIVAGLREALDDAGIRPVGVSLAEAAARWMDEQHAAAEERDRRQEASEGLVAELGAVASRRGQLLEELATAQQAEAHAAEQLELALRSVGAFEAELSVRAGEDAQRLQRFAAAEELRTQVEALAATLARAESEARDALERAAQDAAEAEAAVDRGAATTLTDHTRRARRLAAELPIDQRPEGDPLATLAVLAERLRAHAEVLEHEIRSAEHAAATAADQLEQARAVAQAAGTGLEGPVPVDLHDGLALVLDGHPDRLIVLDEPFSGVGADLRLDLLDVVLERSAKGSLVLLTEDADVLGWAIELPAHVADAVPADALLTATDPSRPAATDPPPADPAVPTTPAPHRVGQR